jgi:YgiT-type zinc finger domain-containing protein
MKCERCGADTAVLKKATKSFGHGQNLIVIEKIPVVRCSTCHDSYLTADTARELDRIRKNRRSLGETRPVLVATFKKSAA